MKTCTRCGQPKELSSFWKRASSPDGRRSICAPCEGGDGARHYAAHADERRAAARVRTAGWRGQPGNAERNRVTAAKWYADSEVNAAAARDRAAEWKAANPDREAATDKAYRQLNRARYGAHVKAYKLRKTQAVPAWANLFFIEEAYDLAARRTEITGFKWEVDHRVPLRSPLVCGLHVENNLAVVPKTFNRQKGNRFWPDMPA